jgi:hypothetical protein
MPSAAMFMSIPYTSTKKNGWYDWLERGLTNKINMKVNLK